jgi:hypothetical protein
MYYYKYPIGMYYNIEKMSFKEINNFPHYFLDVDVVPTNTRYPLFPTNKDGLLVYTCEPFRGVYNDVDIRGMIEKGYVIKNIYRGIYFKRSSYIYSELIKELYNKRMKYKKDKIALEYLIKIFLNNMYGYHNETHIYGSMF